MNPEVCKSFVIKSVLCSYINEAQMMLDLSKAPDEKAVHDARVLMKKSRATIKLVRTQIGMEAFRREYLTLRDVGRKMQEWRESSVQRKLIKYIRKKNPGLFPEISDIKEINVLLNNPEPSIEQLPALKESIGNILGMLRKSGYRIRFQKMDNLDPEIIFNELEATFDEVSDCFIKARINPKVTNLHEFRKRTKDFLYQLFFFRYLNPRSVTTLEKKLDSIADSLGKYNDLAVLIKYLNYKYRSGRNPDSLDELIIIIKQDQDRLLAKVWPSAFRLFRPGKKLSELPGFKFPGPGILPSGLHPDTSGKLIANAL
jgi:CHAD domain-containing protein